jgi:hypothetical protein
VHDAQDDSFALKMIWDYLTAREKTPLALLIGKYFRKFDEFTANINLAYMNQLETKMHR